MRGDEPDWKYTPVGKLQDLLTGPLEDARLQIESSGTAESELFWVDRSDPVIGGAGTPEDRASANAWSHFGRALHLSYAGAAGDVTTVGRHSVSSEPTAAHTIIDVAPGSRGTIVIRSGGLARLTENLEIIVGDGADVTILALQQWSDESVHLASHFVKVGADAHLTHIVISLGGELVRVNPTIHLEKSGASTDALGLYFPGAGQHFEQQVYVHHDAPRSRSRVNYKGALQGDGARGVWIGDVLIGARGTGTDTYEQNRNLLLTDGTRADSVPNLEIAAGDIVGAGHASATGRFDDEQLFYLKARGIPELEARRLVALGFLVEIIQKVPVPTLAEELIADVQRRVTASSLSD